MTEAMIAGAGIALVSFLSGYLAHYLMTLLRVARAHVAVRRAGVRNQPPMPPGNLDLGVKTRPVPVSDPPTRPQ